MDINFNFKRPKKTHSELVGIDFSPTATLVVRLKKTRGVLSLVDVDMLPAVNLKDADSTFELPKSLAANYGSLSYSGLDTVLRVVSAPLGEDDESISEETLYGLLNVEGEYRVSSLLLQRGKGRLDSSFLAAAMPDDEVQTLLGLFEQGAPAPVSLEVAGFAYITAFMHARGEECEDKTICLVDAGEEFSYFAFIHKGDVALVGKYDFGAKQLRSKVVDDLGVDEELATSILMDQSINVSATVMDVMSSFMKQLSISKDFMERRFSCAVSKVYVSGELSQLPTWKEVVEQMLHAEVKSWSPFEKIEYDPSQFSATLEGQESRFVAAVGSVLGGLQES